MQMVNVHGLPRDWGCRGRSSLEGFDSAWVASGGVCLSQGKWCGPAGMSQAVHGMLGSACQVPVEGYENGHVLWLRLTAQMACFWAAVVVDVVHALHCTTCQSS
jgi:hypothetical protein